MSDPVKAIIGTLRRHNPAWDALRIDARRSTPWQSLLFDGARHHIRLIVPNGAADALCETIADPDFSIPGHIVAEMTAVVDHGTENAIVSLETLTIEASR